MYTCVESVFKILMHGKGVILLGGLNYMMKFFGDSGGIVLMKVVLSSLDVPDIKLAFTVTVGFHFILGIY